MKVLFSAAALVLSLMAFAFTSPKPHVSMDVKTMYTDTVPGDTTKKPKDTTTTPKASDLSLQSIR